MKRSILFTLAMFTNRHFLKRCLSLTSPTTKRISHRYPFISSSHAIDRHQRHFLQQLRLKSSNGNDNSENKQILDGNEKPTKKKPRVSKKFKINENASQINADRLAAAFAELARKEGFDDSTSIFSKGKSFDDPFSDRDKIGMDDDNDDDRLETFDEEDDFIEFDSDVEDDMDARIAAAKKDMDFSSFAAPTNSYKQSPVTERDLRKLGFKTEMNPFGDDETPRKHQFRLITDAMTCSACGSDFQCKNENRPGYLPLEKYEIQVKLSKLEAAQKLKQKVETDTEWSPEDEIEYLIQTSKRKDSSSDLDDFVDLDVDDLADEMGIDLLELSQKPVICKRCHGLQNYGKVENSLRPGWTEEPMLSQEKFRELLAPLRKKPAVLIALIDLFDFSGSVLPELDGIAGDNPVIIAANKVDLLPSKMGHHRVENWVRRELEYMGIKSVANIGGAVRLVSCKTGFGISDLLAKARHLAADMDCDVFVVGAANAGKSTLINHILEYDRKGQKFGQKRRAGNANARKGAVTVSPLPGTTLKFIELDFGDGRKLFDTPGLLVAGTLTQLLTPEELKIVIPKKQVEPISFRISSGKCVLIGGLAKVELIGEDTKPFLFTFFVANEIKLHPTDSSKADSFIEKHLGGILTPPLTKREESWIWKTHDLELEGGDWKTASADISLRGLGWVAVTGPGTAMVRITVPEGIGVEVRPPLMPFDVWEVASRYTGGRAVRKVGKSNRKGVGRN